MFELARNLRQDVMQWDRVCSPEFAGAAFQVCFFRDGRYCSAEKWLPECR